MTAPPASASHFALVQPRFERLRGAGVRLLLAGVFGWMAVLGVLQLWAAPRWTNQGRGAAAAALIAPVALGWAWRGYAGRYHAVVVRSGLIELRKGRTWKRVRCAEVLALVADGGVDVSGGELIVWKRLSIVTAEGRDVLEFHHRDNATIYRFLHEACPRAWGLRFPAALDPPGPAGRAGASASRVGLGLIARALRRRSARGAALGSGLVVGCLAVGWLASRSPASAESARGAVFLIVGVVAGLTSIADAARCSRLAARVRRMELG